ncbi:CYTH domain-containing protein [Salibacterium lacus]|uniref:CYTH domain-containing protein n=1 Tax=Salibacterium lacus TaxID=1898109 RepID=A0ABW5SZ92_9BACI
MSRETEIEKKNLLTKEEFKRLCRRFNVNEDQFTRQANTYFDTEQGAVRTEGAALRIREKNKDMVLTLKQPAEEGLLETNQTLSPDETEAVMAGRLFPEGEVKQALTESLHIDPEHIEQLGTLETMRTEFPFKTGILFLDHSTYLDVEDFEIEIEGPSEKEVEILLYDLLKEQNIPERRTPNKIKRFFQRKQELNDPDEHRS